MTERLKLPPFLIKKVISTTMGPDAARFLTLVPFIKSIDNEIDARSAEEWLNSGQATLGTELSPFVEGILRPYHHEFIDKFIASESVTHENMREVLNLLGAQVKAVAQATKAVRDSDNAQTRRRLAHEHEMLNVFACAACAIDTNNLAGVIQSARHEYGDDLKKIYEAVCTLKFAYKKNEINVKEMGVFQQVTDDVNDVLCDLRTEKEFNRIMPNIVLARLVERGVNLDELYKKHQDAIQANRIIEAKELDPVVTSVIQAVLKENRAMIALFKKDMAMRGARADGERFATQNEDHQALDAPKELRIRGPKGTMGWLDRVRTVLERPERAP